MTLHNQLSYDPALIKAFGLAAGMDIGEEGVSRLGESLTPVMNIWELPEWRVLRNEATYSNFVSRAGVAAQRTHVGVRLAAASGFLAVLDRFEIRNTTGGTLRYIFRIEAPAPFTAGGTEATMFGNDARIAVAKTGVTKTVTYSNAAGAIGTAFWDTTLLTGERYLLPFPYVLAPGSQVLVEPDADNTRVDADVQIRERIALPRELVAI